jgi:hypothetical protein
LVGSFADLRIYEHVFTKILKIEVTTILHKLILKTAADQNMFMERIHTVYQRDSLETMQTF